MSRLPLRLGLQQRVLPSYRVPFFDALAGSFEGGMCIFAGQPRPSEMIESTPSLRVARFYSANNIHILSGAFYLCWQRGWKRWLETWQPDVLVVEANPRYLHVPPVTRWMHARKRPVLGWGLGAPGGGTPVGWRDRSRRSFLAAFDALLTYSRQGAEEYSLLGIPRERIFVAPNAVMPRPVWSAPERPDRYSGRPVILFVGRLQERKRVDLLLRACAVLPQELRPQLWIVGVGPAQEALKALARQVYPEACFWGAKHGPELAPLFRQADLFVLPGTGGLAVQEAMAYGLPVAVAEADGTQSDLVRPENGWLLPAGDLDTLVETLKNALSDPGRLRRMGKVSYQIVSGEINLEMMVNAFEEAVRFCWEGQKCIS